MTTVTRYNEHSLVSSPLDPIEDVTSWIWGLKSTGYVSDILSKVHGITPAPTVRLCAQMVAQFASTAIGLLEQAFSGPPNISFLPLYYAILNLSKIYIIAAGKHADLPTNRYHGASYDPLGKSSHDLLTEELSILPKGIFPLLYSVLVPGSVITHRRKLALSSIYPYIRGISHEYHHAYRQQSSMQWMSITVEAVGQEGFRLNAGVRDMGLPNADNLRFYKALAGFKTNAPYDFKTPIAQAPSELEAILLLSKHIRRGLLYEAMFDFLNEPSGTLTPLSNSNMLLPEEVPIWLAFHHLSNVVRYNPEFLHRIENSKAWPMLLAMRKHTLLRFLLLTWSFVHQREFYIQSQ
jgi:hypothetical protein